MKSSQMIYQGDGVEFLKGLDSQSCDFILTDPPYGVLKKEEWDKGLTREQKKQFIREAYRVLSGGIFIFATIQDVPEYMGLLEDEGFLHIRCGVWLKSVATWNSHPYPSNALEYWIFADKVPGWKGRETLLPFYIASPTARPLTFEKELHPTRKPITLLRTIIHNHTCEDDVIVDPFAGSGSTGVAALLENRKPLLNERDSVFIKMIERNITNFQKFTGREKMEAYMASESTADKQKKDAEEKPKPKRQSFTPEQEAKCAELVFRYTFADAEKRQVMDKAWFLQELRGEPGKEGKKGPMRKNTKESRIWNLCGKIVRELDKKKVKGPDGNEVKFCYPKQSKAEALTSHLESLIANYQASGEIAGGKQYASQQKLIKE